MTSHATRGPGYARHGRRQVAAIGALALALAACDGNGDDQGADFPDGDIRMIIPSEPGGGFDTTARQLQPFLEEELGVSLVMDNLGGGNFAVGTQAMAQAEGDCNTIEFIGIPHLPFSYLSQDVDYTYDDFYPIASVSVEPGVIRVRDDAPWSTFEELLEDARSRPGEIRASVGGMTNNNAIGILEIQEEFDVEFNIVPYDGGGPARTAVVSGEVEMTHAGVFNSLSIADDTRVLAVHQDENEWPDVTDGAPTINDELGTEMEPNGSDYGIWTSRECFEEYPDRHAVLEEALLNALESEDFLASLADIGEQDKVSVMDAEEYHAFGLEETERLEEYVQQNPDVIE